MTLPESVTTKQAWTRYREPPEPTTLPEGRVALWRAGLVGSCLAAALLGMLSGDPAAYLQANPDLARLLRGMALIKAALVLAAIAVIWWRYSRPLSHGLSSLYLVGATAMVLAAVMVWQLSHLAGASILFHAGIFLLLGCAYLDTAGPADASRKQRNNNARARLQP